MCPTISRLAPKPATNSLISAFIDFSESEEIELDVLDRARVSAEQLRTEFSKQLTDAKVGERLREGGSIFLDFLLFWWPNDLGFYFFSL